MIELNGRVRLTKSEFARLRRDAARRGHAVDEIETTEDYVSALALVSSPALIDDLLEALETGSSRLIRGEATYEDLKADDPQSP